MNPFLLCDFYKVCHHSAYVEGLEFLTTYWTPRMSRKDGVDKVVMFGLQGFIEKYLVKYFDENFFSVEWDVLEKEYVEVISKSIGVDAINMEHIKDVYRLGFLPIEIEAIPEGMRVPIKTPMIKITNTIKGYAWLVNYLETLMSCNLWQPMTSATIAYQFREVINEYYEKTVCNRNPVTACGDFSMRGMGSIESAQMSGAGHLLSFNATATIPAIKWIEECYAGNIEEIGKGCFSMEHSVMCSYGKEELECFKHLITEAFPTGNISIVSDTYDYWNVLTEILPQLKNDILNRDGTVIIRGDSGCPIKIICGDIESQEGTPERKGTIELLWDVFGGHVNEKGYKVLNDKIRAIYGDSITIDRCWEICNQLEKKGFSVENITFGIGSFTYQYVTRDTLSFALKATHAVLNGEEKFIFKEPKTDGDNFKKSQKGLCLVYEKDGEIIFRDGLYQADINNERDKQLLTTVFKNGALTKKQTFREIRGVLWDSK